MNARTKLNTGYIHGSLLFAVLTGWLTESLLVFGLTAVALIVGSFHSGDIRLSSSPIDRNTGRSRR